MVETSYDRHMKSDRRIPLSFSLIRRHILVDDPLPRFQEEEICASPSLSLLKSSRGSIGRSGEVSGALLLFHRHLAEEDLVEDAEFAFAAGAPRVDINQTTWSARWRNVIEVLLVVVIILLAVAPVRFLDEHQPSDRALTHRPKLVVGLRVPSLFWRGVALAQSGVVLRQKGAHRPVVGCDWPSLVTHFALQDGRG